MFERLVQVSRELSDVLDQIESEAYADCGRGGLRARQAKTLIERVRVARNATSDQLSMLMREVQATEKAHRL